MIRYLLLGFTFWFLTSLLLMYVTFTHFAAVMRARELKEKGLISPQKDPILYWTAILVLAVGVLLDVLLNVWTFTPIGMELPRELLTTSRLDRWLNSKSTSWWHHNVRLKFVALGKLLLDPVDTDGVHIK